MLPSKGYFKSLNCPYFANGFCDRPHCHFRHTRKDKGADELQQLEGVDQSSQINDGFPDVFTGETSSDSSSWVGSQQLASSSISYKPTPIVELKKRHIPVTTAPCVTLSSTSQKRRIEYDVKGIKKPKVEYIPEALGCESSSSFVYPKNGNNAVYRATKISDQPDQFNGSNVDENALLQEAEESEGEIDFDQVSNELNFLDELLKEYGKPDPNVTEQKIPNIADFNEDSSLEKEERQNINNGSEAVSNKVSNGLIKHCQITSESNNKSCSSESDPINLNETKKHKSSNQKVKSSHSDSKIANVNNLLSNIENNGRKSTTSSSMSHNKVESKRSSEQRRKSDDSHRSEKDRHKDKDGSDTLSVISKQSKKESGSESTFNKLLSKSDSHKSSTSSKESKRKHTSSSNKLSHKGSEHKNSSSKPPKKDSERESISSKSLIKESERKSTSSKSLKKDSDQQSRVSKSSKSELHESSKNRTSGSESQRSKSKHKENSKAEYKKSGTASRSSSKYKNEDRHRKENNAKRSTKENKTQNSKEIESRERSYENRGKRRQSCSVSKSEQSSDDDVEIISDHESIIVIDSEEDTNSEDSLLNKKRKVETVSSSPSPACSTGVSSPTFPSDISDTSEVEDNTQDGHTQSRPITSSNGTVTSLKSRDEASQLDHRVQSQIKHRVSLGPAWRPPKRKAVEITTPAQRLLLFAKLREQEEKDSDSQSAARVKIGCVPNVKLLLEEKERLLKSGPQKNSLDKSNISTYQFPLQPEDKDVVPTSPRIGPHPRNRGADIFTRKPLLEKFYKYEKQLLEPGKRFLDASRKSVEEEFKIWLTTEHETYEKAMANVIQNRKSEIPDFTLRFFYLIQPSTSVLFPKELRGKLPNGEENPNPTSEESLYSWILKYKLSEEQLESEGYPRSSNSSSQGKLIAYINEASLNKWKKFHGVPPSGEYVCHNCSKFYSVDNMGLSIRRGECTYHAKKSFVGKRDKSGLPKRVARCCGHEAQEPCMTSEYHSTETRDMQHLEGYVETQELPGEMPLGGWGIYALDCEMYWSTRGQELGRVTVVNAEERTIYDTFVKPEYQATDYATRLSGITKDHLEKAPRSFTEVQRDLLRLFNSKTILIGHSLENDMKALQIIHHTVVDTAMVFKHGEYKVALKTLAKDLLKTAIQNEEDGHDSAEDAVTCMQLIRKHVFKSCANLAKRAPPAPRGRYRPNQMGI